MEPLRESDAAGHRVVHVERRAQGVRRLRLGEHADVARVAPAAAVRTRQGTAGLDLRAGVAEILGRAGIPEVVQDPRCTVEDPSLFSHRRDGVTGRQAGLVWLG